MKIKKLWVPFGLVLFSLSIAHAGELPGDGSQGSGSFFGQGQRNVIGTISRATEHMLTVETAQGITRRFTVKSAAIDGVTKLQPGDRVLLELDEGNQIIGIHDIDEKHQLIHGEFVGIDQSKKIVTLKLTNGKSQSYEMKEALAGKMNNIAKGAFVTLMVDPRNNLAMDVQAD